MSSSSRLTFKDRAYWDERFESETHFEWFAPYALFRDWLRAAVRPSDEILVAGCGTSRLSADLFADGFRNVMNVDYSVRLIDRMREQHADCSGMTWVAADLTAMEPVIFTSSVDVVFDKSTIDSIACRGEDVVAQYVREVLRVLRPGGRFLAISCSNGLEELLDPSTWRFERVEMTAGGENARPRIYHSLYTAYKL